MCTNSSVQVLRLGYWDVPLAHSATSLTITRRPGFNSPSPSSANYFNGDEDDDRINPAPSPVVHVRGLTDLVTEGNLMQAVQHFGVVSYVMMMSRKHMALIEFENITGARNCVEYSQHNQIFVGDHPAFFNYSTSSKIQRPSGEAGEVKSANHILLYTVLNPQYPITVDVMHTINSPYGQVQRIVIFKKNGVQAMQFPKFLLFFKDTCNLENDSTHLLFTLTINTFESIDSAKRAKQNLNGADIYSGCCTLKIEFAKPTRLNVIRNDQDSWDYTNPNLGKEPQGQQGRPAPLLQDPRYSNIPTPYEQKMNSGYGGQAPPQGGGGAGYQGQGGYSGPPQQGYGSPQGGYSPPGSGGYGMYDQGDGYGGYPPSSSRQYDMGPPSDRYSSSKPPMHDRGYGRPPSTYSDGPPPPGGSMIQGSVLMVYGLDMERINCDKLFNLFCLYGNVVRIKFLKSKEGSAMIQMGDSLALERCMQNLNYIHFFGSKVQLGHSKQAFLQDVPNPHELPDGSPSFKDFMGSRNNRFANPEAAAKNHILLRYFYRIYSCVFVYNELVE
ncbi:hypothetical protein FSP39_003104 [Pinctada imbricata]|uniref:RRM domain-containing protein n=1 Tax=Pinctada imbricata TaxID=66713 RepID=A0AA88XCM4_PINIB|nr:hypothetical protein FSP39_003104 [Pinctada imbricata]